ncbi:solute carrier family 22 member 20-like isoform X1 [Scylla paramamosain]|uniref:solute carrier family 22 member 20-like isoform X1 n=1 Tax=Scylla paramamosain TaxID=85552 RepID=UPI0030835243
MGSTERRLSSITVNAESEDDGFDDLLSSIGFGRWQAISVVVVLIIAALLPVQMVGMTLIAPPIPFRCYGGSFSTAENQSALTVDDKLREILELGKLNKTEFDERCLPASEQDEDSMWLHQPKNSIITGMKSCPIIEYDSSIFSSSVVSDFHLVCEEFHMQAFYQIMYTVGGALGSAIGGQIGDRFGRRRAVQLGAVLYLGGILAIAFVPLYEVVLMMRVILGFANTSMLVTGWNMVIEGSPATARTLTGMLMGLPFSIFIMLLAGVGYFIRTWQNLLLACSAPVFFLIPLSFIVDESPRWLLQQNRSKEAYAILQKAVRLNKAKIKGDLSTIVDKIAQRNRGKHPDSLVMPASTFATCMNGLHEMMEYFRSPGMRIILIVTPIIWFFQSFVYLGLAINANNFSSNDPFLYVALTGVMDCGSILLSTPATPFLGRRVMIGTELFTGGVLLLVELVVPDEYSWVKWVLVMIGFLLVAGAFQVNFVYAPELFPTLARTRGFAFVNLVGNVGFMCAPLITTNLAKISRWAPGVVFGCSGILISLLVPLLPETNKKPLPENLQDVEDRWRESKFKYKSRATGSENLAYTHDGERDLSSVRNGSF